MAILSQSLLLRVELAVATAVNEQIGVSIASVDVYIDSLVFLRVGLSVGVLDVLRP